MLRVRPSFVLPLCATLAAACPAVARDRGAPATPPEVPSGPAAEPSGLASDAADVVEARNEFRRGSSLARAGDWEAALAAFQRSATLKPHAVTSYDVAYCERALGRYVRASFGFEEALQGPAGAPKAELTPELTRDAETYLADVRNKIGRVTVNLKPPDLTLQVDGQELERHVSADGTVYVVSDGSATPESAFPARFVIWLDPGSHAFAVASRDGGRSVENRTLGAGERAIVTFSLDARAPSLPPPPPRSTAGPDAVERVPDRTWAYVAFGVGAVGLVGGAVFSGLALGEKSSLDSDPACSKKSCPPGYADRESRMTTFADLATAGLVTLAVGASAGTVLWLTGTPTKAKTARVLPWFAGNAAGVAGRF